MTQQAAVESIEGDLHWGSGLVVMAKNAEAATGDVAIIGIYLL